jgi:hypothetical protein
VAASDPDGLFAGVDGSIAGVWVSGTEAVSDGVKAGLSSSLPDGACDRDAGTPPGWGGCACGKGLARKVTAFMATCDVRSAFRV